MTLLVYTEQPSTRLTYACEVVVRKGLACDVQVTNDRASFESSDLPRINYSLIDTLPGFHIAPSGLLNETGVRAFEPSSSSWEGVPTLFTTSGADLPFDIFSAAFFLLTRYEEYNSSSRDRFGRFSAVDSLAYRSGFLNQPVIDQWVKRLHSKLQQSQPNMPEWRHRFSFRSTIDVDSAFAYRHKGLKRTLGGVAKDILRFDLANLKSRLSCLSGRMKDPYDTYDWFHQLHEQHNTEVIWFFLLADFGAFDKGVPYTSLALAERMRECSRKARVGVHPGFAAHDDLRRMATEFGRFTSILGERPQLSRQHYLRLNFPQTYQNLVALEIAEDHTMGFADQTGFRAGTSRPFPWYDLSREEQSMLMIYPFAAMDATLRRYLNLSPDAAFEELKSIGDGLKNCDGTFTVLWHNESVANFGEWQGWAKVYQQLIEEFS